MCMEWNVPFNGLEVRLNLSIHWNQCVVCAYLSTFIYFWNVIQKQVGYPVTLQIIFDELRPLTHHH